MVEDGHFEEVTKIIGRLPDKDHRNTFLFSATLTFTIDRLDESKLLLLSPAANCYLLAFKVQ